MRLFVWKRSLLMFALIALITSVIYLFWLYNRIGLSMDALLLHQTQVDMRPVGELTKGVILRQPLDLSSLNEIDSQDPNALVYLGVLMANYNNRQNKGSVLIGLEVDKRLEFNKVDVDVIKDNQYHYIGFENLTWSDLLSANSVEIILQGVDGESGSAVTAWATKDLSYGHLISDPHLLDRSLLFRLGVENKSSMRDVHVLFLLVFGLTAIFFLITQPARKIRVLR